MYFSKATVAASALFLGTAYGHMVMNTPTPYGFSDLQTAPLNGENYLFPCQSGSRTDAFDGSGVSNPVTAGGSQLVKFTGSAVHGGGSCQFSVTYDYPPPSDPSKWKVIHTIIGGCPASAAGNIATQSEDSNGRPTGKQCGDSTSTECLRQFDIPIPSKLKNGNATFAWTWFNKIGNREMYMNCAPISITGGSDDDSFVESLPEMFMANYPGKCTTGEGVLNIPNPGTSVQQLESPAAGSNGNCAAASSVPSASTAVASASSAPGGGYGYGSSSAAPVSSIIVSTATPDVTPTYAASSSFATPTRGVSSVPGVFAPGASVAVPSDAEPSAAPSVTLATIIQSTASPVTVPVATGSSSSSVDKIACTNEGGVVCMGDTFFGLCDHGFAVKMAVSEGTKCQNGAIARRSYPRRHLHARIHRHS